MNLSVLNSSSLPASAFPEPADRYVCDDCGRDVTKHLHRSRAHEWSPMGPSYYQCHCGRKYRTGATEWDYLGRFERRRRAGKTLFLSEMLLIPASFVGLIVYFLLYGSEDRLIIALATASLPSLLINLYFWMRVSGSVWRTRFSRSAADKH